ncbi:hypothetical protein C3L33_18743, partial [Rhododendron williamsianum]
MAQSNPVVKVLDVCRVAPTPHTPNSTAQTSLPLTFFDLLWLRFPPTQRLFFYKLSYPETTLIDTILPKLKHSLSVTLQHYIPLAGNLTWPLDSGKPIVQYNEGDAVSLTVAESEANFYQLSGNSFREAKELHHFLPYLLASQTRVPVMALQITLFPNAGFCVGYAANHAVFDGKSIAMFMHSWASICKRDGESTLNNGANDRSLEFRDMKAPPDAMLYRRCGYKQVHEEDGVAIAAWAIGEAVGGLADGVLKGAKELIPNYLSRLKEGGLVSIAGSPDSRDGNGGVEIGVVLKKHESEAFASLFASGLEYHQSIKAKGIGYRRKLPPHKLPVALQLGDKLKYHQLDFTGGRNSPKPW